MCSIFLGRWGKLAYEIILTLFSTTGLWSYATVFATSTASIIPLVGVTQINQCNFDDNNVPTDCDTAYYVYMAIFAVIVLTISCFEMTETWIVQVSLTCYRFFALTIMIVTLYLAMFAEPYNFTVTAHAPYIATHRAFHWAGFSTVFSTAVFAQMMHHSCPGLAQPVRQKSTLRKMFFTAYLCTFVFYTLVGVLAALYFGPGTNQLVTLNWRTYSGLGFNPPSLSARPLYSVIISYFIIMFPVLDILSAFPLNVVTLGNNIFYGLPDRWTNAGRSRPIKIICRLSAGIPPLILASVFRSLTTIISFAGSLGFFLAFIFPGLLQIFSIRRTKQMFNGSWSTPFTWHFSHPIYAYVVVVLASIGFVFMIVDLALTSF